MRVGTNQKRDWVPIEKKGEKRQKKKRRMNSLTFSRQKGEPGVAIVADGRSGAATATRRRMRELAPQASPRLRDRADALRTTPTAQCHCR